MDLPLLPSLTYKNCKGCGLRFAAPSASKARYCSDRCRHLSRQANSKYRSGTYVAKSGRKEHYDSSLEEAHFRSLDQQGITWTRTHGIKIRYVDPKGGRERWYLPDVLVTLADGTKVLQECKPVGLLSDATVQAKARAARAWCQQRGIEYVFVTVPGQVR